MKSSQKYYEIFSTVFWCRELCIWWSNLMVTSGGRIAKQLIMFSWRLFEKYIAIICWLEGLPINIYCLWFAWLDPLFPLRELPDKDPWGVGARHHIHYLFCIFCLLLTIEYYISNLTILVGWWCHFIFKWKRKWLTGMENIHFLIQCMIMNTRI